MKTQSLSPTYHDDGTITYWSVYQQCWLTATPGLRIPDPELAAMPAAERQKMINWMEQECGA